MVAVRCDGGGAGRWPVLLPAHAQAEPDLRTSYTVVGDGIPRPLTSDAPSAENGRAHRHRPAAGLCLLCHSGPFPEERFQGDLATDLAGAGSRWSEAQLRLRIVDASRLNPQTIMPSYYRTQGLERVGWQ